MIKVLDLFSGTQSVKKGLDEMNVDYEYYGIDIYSPEDENVILDLSQDDIVNKVISVLPKGWNPDFIWASPPCNKFSRLSTGENGNFYFEKTSIGLKPRENWDIKIQPNYRNRVDGAYDEANIALKIVNNVIEILNHYDVKFIIENPFNSLIERVLPYLIIKNRADYCAYGFDYMKPTAIYSNHAMELKTCKCKTKHKIQIQTNDSFMNYKLRASVPPKLIVDILNKMLGGNQ